jgi:dipeptidyl aminopeptidase/acylaminoacyl peptidase
VKLEPLSPATEKPLLLSALETVAVTSTDRRVEYVAAAHFEAPNWTRDGSAFIFNQEGTLRRLAIGSAEPVTINTAPQIHCNNDHGLSPDGQMLAISDRSPEDQKSRVYVVPLAGGTPRQLTKDGPSYWHGWSPDGKTLAFTGERGGNFDIYTVPVAGGEQTRLTTAEGLDDGPEYSPDGAVHHRRQQRLVPTHLARRTMDGLPGLRGRRDGAPRGEGRGTAAHVNEGQVGARAGPALWRAGNHQRPIVVARQPQVRLCQL